jgi:uncharacterized protein
MTYHGIEVDPHRVALFCKEHKIVRLALFGSILRDDFGAESDVDVLVEFADDAAVGFFSIVEMERELTDMFGRRAEIHTYRGLHPLYRDDVIRSSTVHYEQAGR